MSGNKKNSCFDFDLLCVRPVLSTTNNLSRKDIEMSEKNLENAFDEIMAAIDKDTDRRHKEREAAIAAEEFAEMVEEAIENAALKYEDRLSSLIEDVTLGYGMTGSLPKATYRFAVLQGLMANAKELRMANLLQIVKMFQKDPQCLETVAGQDINKAIIEIGHYI